MQMRIDYLDYTRLLAHELKRRKVENNLPPLLLNPTPTNIRRECENVCKERFERKDEPALRAFFGPAEGQRQFLQVIKDLPTDKFKPIVNYLKGETEKTEDKNLELLAWLIDFRHRPGGFGKEVLLTEEELAIIGRKPMATAGDTKSNQDSREISQDKKSDQNGAAVEPLEEQPQNIPVSLATSSRPFNIKEKFGAHTKNLLVLLLLLVVGGMTIYIAISNTGCMYWTGDHYEKIPCDQKKNGVLTIPIDKVLLRDFRKIPNDSITMQSIGIVYYLREDNNVECFTMPGNHPVLTTRALRRLTATIYHNYIKRDSSSHNNPR